MKIIALKKYNENKNFLEKCELFLTFETDKKQKILETLVLQVFNNKVIIREGDTGESLYIIKSGKVRCSIEGKFIKELNEGDYFGEQSLLNENIRTATITAIEKVTLICFERSDLERIFGYPFLKIIYRNSQTYALSKDRLLSRLTTEQIQQITKNTVIHKYKTQKFIAKKGKPYNKISIVLKGKVVMDDIELDSQKCIGSEILLDIEKSQNDFITKGPVECAEITKELLESIIKGKFKEVIQQNSFIAILHKIPLFSNISQDGLRAISKSLIIKRYESNDIIFTQDTYGDEFFIINTGEVMITINGKYIRTNMKESYFGERALLMNEPRTATVISKTSSEMLVLKKNDFESLFDKSIRAQLLKRINLQNDSIELEDLSVIKLIGKGTFGSVFLVAHKKTRELYALKSISNTDIRHYKIKKNIKTSKEILLQIENMFVIKLIKTLSDSERVYFLMEYVPSITLAKALQDFQPFDKSQILFYFSNMILMIKYLHSLKIMHRDLKPENILIDSEGYLKLIDFDTACMAEERNYTIAGTPHYIAPEMIKGNGYGLSVDI